jgi:hypothetical protein
MKTTLIFAFTCAQLQGVAIENSRKDLKFNAFSETNQFARNVDHLAQPTIEKMACRRFSV